MSAPISNMTGGSLMTAAARFALRGPAFFLLALCLSSGALAQLQWAPARDGAVPRGAVYGGKQTNQHLAICRAWYQNGVHPGKVVGRNCNIAWGDREITIPSYEVLVGNAQTLNFVSASNGSVPRNPVYGGQEPGRQLPICNADYHGGTHPGKLVGNGCQIGWGGRAVSLPRYRVLTYKAANQGMNPPNMPGTQSNSSLGYGADLPPFPTGPSIQIGPSIEIAPSSLR